MTFIYHCIGYVVWSLQVDGELQVVLVDEIPMRH